ncbi:hypothetical protein, partial [Pseudomonas sp. S60]|uniref:hypothetical protein n=1 Tax=Pseudomonas sp. S60 TaxID=211124 RepID=UPI001F297AC5
AKPPTPRIYWRCQSWHGSCYMLSTKTITSTATHNKNKTKRLTHNKNKTAEAQLTDSFGEDECLGFAPRSGREQQKLH